MTSCPSLVAKLPTCDAPEFVVHVRHQDVEGLASPRPEVVQKPRYVLAVVHRQLVLVEEAVK